MLSEICDGPQSRRRAARITRSHRPEAGLFRGVVRASAKLEVIFTSNFFEHLPAKHALEQTLLEAHKALLPGGLLIAMGPNIKYLPGAYWDFFDHYLPLTELSLIEVLRKCGFEVVFCRDRFLPYTMSDGREYPVWMLRLYLKMPLTWRLFGKQFLVVARKNV